MAPLGRGKSGGMRRGNAFVLKTKIIGQLAAES